MPQRITVPMSEVKRITVPMSEIKRVSEVDKPSTPPATGVSDPTRDLPATGAYGNPFGGLSGETIKGFLGDLLSPFSARSGTGNWQVPPAISGIASTLGQIISPEDRQGQPDPIVDMVKGAAGGPPQFVQGIRDVTTTGDTSNLTEGASRTVRDTLPAIYGGVKAAQGSIQGLRNSRNLSLGRTSFDELGQIKPPIQPTIVEVGVEPVLTGTELLEYSAPVRLLAEGLGGKQNLLKMNRMQQSFNQALPDLKHAQSTTVRTGIDTPEKLRLVADTARNRVWNDSIAPAIVGEVDLTPIGEGMLKSIPDSIRIQKPKQYLAIVRDINSRFIGKQATAKQVHTFAKEARAAIRSALAKNDFDMAAALETPHGKMAAAYNDTLRDVLWKHVETQTGRDIRPQLQRYGALSDIEQSALKSTVPPTFIERIFGSYVPPTQSGLKGRVGASAFGHWIDDYSKIRRAFDQYQLEPAKVTPPFNARYAGPQRQLGPGAPQLPAADMPLDPITTPYAPATREIRTGRLLTEGSPVLPPLASDIPSALQNNLSLEAASRYKGNVGYPGSMELPLPSKPRLGDRLMIQGQMHTYSRKGWIPSRNPSNAKPQSKIPKIVEP